MPNAQPTTEELAAMREAVDRALKAQKESGKAGIAAAILLHGTAIGRGENQVRLQSDPTKHAEMVALTEAGKKLGSTDLSQCVMISTLQPCEMCLAAMRFAGIKRVIFGATQDKVAAKYFVFPGLSLTDFQKAGEPFEAIGGQLEDELLPLYVDGQE
ncbi:MAG: nucleoside deaminase [Verrucomicrobiaceae bacterium]|nr:MAG: nucleoside deaminase [Verrucomicrobiaceae bacterium]